MIFVLYWVAIAGLTLFNIHKLVLLGTHYLSERRNPRQKVVSTFPISRRDAVPFATIQLPVYNENAVVRRLLKACLEIDYPKDRMEIQVLDDSTDDTTQLIRDLKLDVVHIHRTNREGFKAGALANGMKTAKGEFLAILDADFIPPKDFLKRTIAEFTSPDIGMVQAKWTFLNGEQNFLTKSQALFLGAHFTLEHAARFHSNLFFNFNGTAGVWRKSAIVDAGGWSADTLTEDLDLSFRALMRKWKFVYLNDLEVPSELPSDMRSLRAQQFRWAKGMMEVALKLLPRLWRSEASLWQKIDSTFNLLSPLGYVSSAVALCAFPAWDPRFVIFNTASLFVFYAFSEWRQHRLSPRRLVDLLALMLVGVILSFNGTLAVISALSRKKSSFVRTPKTGDIRAFENEKFTRRLWRDCRELIWRGPVAARDAREGLPSSSRASHAPLRFDLEERS